MAKKKHSKTKGGTAAAATPEALDRDAQAALDAGRWRDAMSGFKRLLKDASGSDPEREQRHRAALAAAYAGRARELAAKGMDKEALVIWENRAALGGDAALAPEHAALLLRRGDREQVLAGYQGRQVPAGPERERLQALLAAWVIAGDEAIAAALPEADPVRRYAGPARAALAAFCNGDDAALSAALGEIPFRSPYRDWSLLLKALRRIAEGGSDAGTQLGRIADDSPFAPLRCAAELSLLPEAEFRDALANAGRSQAAFAAALRGWPPERLALAEELARLGADPQPQTLLRLLQEHREALGAEWVRGQSLRLLIGDYPDSLRWLEAAGAAAPSQRERLLLEAWSAEYHQELWEEPSAWEAVAEELAAQAHNDPAAADPKTALQVALALRRFDARHGVLDDPEPAGDPEAFDALAAERVEQSLAWDPAHRDSYLRLIGWYRRGKRLKDARQVLERARERWPENMQVLTAALELALDSGAFKKAAGLAKRMLALDPINSEVRRRLIDAHLAHTAKQVDRRRTDLAHRELAQAGEWLGRSGAGDAGEYAREELALADGLVQLLDLPEAGRQRLQQTLEHYGGGLRAQVGLALTCDTLRLRISDVFAQLKLKRAGSRDAGDLRAALTRLRVGMERRQRISRGLRDWLTQALNKAPWRALTHAELESACETLRRLRLDPPRLQAAKAALKQFKRAPVFELHAFEAKHADRRLPSETDLWRLHEAMQRAEEAGDTRTATRIREALPLPAFGPIPPLPPPHGGPFDEPDDDSPDLEALAAALDRFDVGRLRDLLDLLPPREVLTLLGAPAGAIAEFDEIARREGKAAARALVERMLDTLDSIGAAPPRGGGGGSRRRGKRAAGGQDEPDDDPPSQHSLF